MINKEVKVAIKNIINKILKAMEEGESSHEDLLSILFDSNSQEIEHGNKNSGMNIYEVIEECKLFYSVG